MGSFGSWGGVEAAGPIPSHWCTRREQWGRHKTAAIPCCIFSGSCNLCKAAKPLISCSCGSGHFNSLSPFSEPHSISVSTAKARAVSGSAVSVSSCELQPLHPPPQGLDVGSQVGQSWTEPFSFQQSSVAQHGASEACLLMSHLRLQSYFISLNVKNHHQPACDLSVPETTRVWAGGFFFPFLLYKNVSKT